MEIQKKICEDTVCFRKQKTIYFFFIFIFPFFNLKKFFGGKKEKENGNYNVGQQTHAHILDEAKN
jgi:hypothetical protein